MTTTAARRTFLIFASLWLGLALWQYTRSASVCIDRSVSSGVLWGLQFLLLGTPLIVIWRAHGRGLADDTPPALGVTLVLLTYVPLTLALRLAELCITHR